MQTITKITPTMSVKELFDFTLARQNAIQNHYLKDTPALLLKDAMAHILNNSGKRLRALLIYATGSLFDAPIENSDIPAIAVELIHAYSLIHDDLPCMDDANLRRGQPTCHKVYGEGMAVLTGDALHTLAMQLLADHPAPLSPPRRLAMIKTLTQACGPFGMAAGQAMDITVMSDANLSASLLTEIYRLKTGALFTACLELGRLASNNTNDFDQTALQKFGENIGLAFQIQDDIFDIEGETNSLGKSQGIDEKHQKITYPKMFNLAMAKEKVDTLYLAALQNIDYLGSRAQLLREVCQVMLKRKK